MRKTIVLGVIGVDAHVVGNEIIAMALKNANFNVVNLGTFVLSEDYIKAVLETDFADAISVIILGETLGIEGENAKDHSFRRYRG